MKRRSLFQSIAAVACINLLADAFASNELPPLQMRFSNNWKWLVPDCPHNPYGEKGWLSMEGVYHLYNPETHVVCNGVPHPILSPTPDYVTAEKIEYISVP